MNNPKYRVLESSSNGPYWLDATQPMAPVANGRFLVSTNGVQPDAAGAVLKPRLQFGGGKDVETAAAGTVRRERERKH